MKLSQDQRLPTQFLQRHRKDQLDRLQLLLVNAIVSRQRRTGYLNFADAEAIRNCREILFLLGDAPLQWCAGYDLMYIVKRAHHILKDQVPGVVDIRKYTTEHGLLYSLYHAIWQVF